MTLNKKAYFIALGGINEKNYKKDLTKPLEDDINKSASNMNRQQRRAMKKGK